MIADMIAEEKRTPTNIEMIKGMIKEGNLDLIDIAKLLYAEDSSVLIDEKGPRVTIDTSNLGLLR